MSEIYLLRHGAYEEGESTLNSRGIKQIKTVIEYLREAVSKLEIFSSSGPRAIQTAHLIADEFQISVQVVSWLNKTVDFQKLDLESKVSESTNLNQVLLVTSGEFIHNYIENFFALNQVQNPLKPLVKGEVILCKLSKQDFFVRYF